MLFSFSFKFSAASLGVWVAARKASGEIISAELPKRRRERLACSCRQVSSGEMIQTEIKLFLLIFIDEAISPGAALAW